MLTNIALLGLLAVPTPRVPALDAFVVRPRIEVWSSHGDGVYTRGQGVRVYFRADQDAFVTLFRVDTDGRVRVLFPRDPAEDNFVRGGQDFEVQGNSGRDAFYVDDYAGVGYLFGVAAADPFEYSAIESGNHWDYRTIADGRVRGDPYVALTELAERIVPEGYADWDYDIVPYYVERQYDYPRFLCYDCHSYVSYPYWNPYWRSCVRFRIVLYDDPYYYPYRYYGGRRVVFVRPFRPQPRFVFKDRDGSGRDRFVTREANRPVNDDTRRTPPNRREAGSTSFIPAPRDMPRRERPTGAESVDRSSGQNRPDDRGSERRRPREDQSQERQTPARPERVQPSDRGQADDRARGQRVPADVPRWEPTPRNTTPRETPRAEPRSTPRAEPRAEPRAAPQREQPRAERPRSEPRAQPQREQPRAERPRSEPKAQPQRSEPKSKGDQPELRRRKPD